MRRLRGAALLWAALACVGSAAAAADDPEVAEGARPGPSALVRADTRPLGLGFGSGGFGLALGGELALGRRLSIVADIQYMDLSDADVSMLTANAGPRVYFTPPAGRGLYAGAYLSGLYGRRYGAPAFLLGFELELGFAYLPWRRPGFLVEPYIKYPYFFGDEMLVGIAPGLSIGWGF
jgi:hypothetical protein